ncbi:MAG: hypothetical protein ACRDZM_17915 [Acidimicrobiia bacterium]
MFAEAMRMLRPGGRFAIADIVAEVELTPQIVANTDLWASCIGGAAQQDAYQEAIEAGGLRLELMKKNQYRFLSEQALGASERYGVKSVSILARKDGEANKAALDRSGSAIHRGASIEARRRDEGGGGTHRDRGGPGAGGGIG